LAAGGCRQGWAGRSKAGHPVRAVRIGEGLWLVESVGGLLVLVASVEAVEDNHTDQADSQEDVVPCHGE